jgi:hypothetical protein
MEVERASRQSRQPCQPKKLLFWLTKFRGALGLLPGYRRLFVLLRQRGEPSGIHRLYREEGQSVCKRRARRAVGDPGRGQAECPLVAGLCL